MLENINIKRFKIYNLQKKYNILSEIIYKLQEHITIIFLLFYFII